eukprot:Skav207546  [mRNA]  locus=scaffold2295:41529:49358:+ [translate_table: standard]
MLRADRAIALAAAKRHGYSLQFASQNLRADKAVVLAAVRQYASALAYSPELQECSLGDRTGLRVIQQHAFALQFAAEPLQVDHEASSQRNLHIKEAPEKASDLLVRPEETLAPGDALVEQPGQMLLVQTVLELEQRWLVGFGKAADVS